MKGARDGTDDTDILMNLQKLVKPQRFFHTVYIVVIIPLQSLCHSRECCTSVIRTHLLLHFFYDLCINLMKYFDFPGIHSQRQISLCF